MLTCKFIYQGLMNLETINNIKPLQHAPSISSIQRPSQRGNREERQSGEGTPQRGTDVPWYRLLSGLMGPLLRTLPNISSLRNQAHPWGGSFKIITGNSNCKIPLENNLAISIKVLNMVLSCHQSTEKALCMMIFIAKSLE